MTLPEYESGVRPTFRCDVRAAARVASPEKGRRYATIAADRTEHRCCEERRGEPERRVAVRQHQEGSGIPQFNELEVHGRQLSERLEVHHLVS
jgi:hypothetical protein